MTDEEPRTVRLVVNVWVSNYQRVEGAALINGESRTDAVNRSFAFYEIISTASPNTLVTYADAEGVEHQLVVLGPKSTRQASWWRRLLWRRTS